MAGVMLRRHDLWQVPLVGEIVSIDGNPYRIIHTGWALPDLDEMGPETPIQYAYVKVQKASNFTVNLGGREY
jgi:hypothetical protein